MREIIEIFKDAFMTLVMSEDLMCFINWKKRKKKHSQLIISVPFEYNHVEKKLVKFFKTDFMIHVKVKQKIPHHHLRNYKKYS